MADTNIEWADAVWNPVRGCSRVSEGCRNCYAEHQAIRITRFDRAKGVPEGQGAYDGLVTMTSQGPKWTGKIRELPEKLHEPLTWKKPKRIFVNSMSDLFHEGVSIQFIAEVFAYMAYARQHTFMVLTKRAERMHQVLNSEEFEELYFEELYDDATTMAHTDACEILGRRGEFNPLARVSTDIRAMDPTLPRPNIQLGVSVEDQPTADERIPLLLATPAAVHFISYEPALDGIWIKPYLQPHCERHKGQLGADGRCDVCEGRGLWETDEPLQEHEKAAIRPGLAGVIAGGESGRGSRLMKADWMRSIRDQCVDAGVPFFFKQWGGADKKEAGRLLDGREWNELPGAA